MAYEKAVYDLLVFCDYEMIFLYRDLRDVAVSQMFHILAPERAKLLHPGKDQYLALANEQQVLIAILEGLGDYPGLLDRWRMFTPWLDIPWALNISFETARHEPETAARLMLQYIFERRTRSDENNGTLSNREVQILIEAMLAGGAETGRSHTFRKGDTGDWLLHFTGKVCDRFKQLDDGWLIRLGYETGSNW